ncbi:MAG: hypothetical protein JJU02_00860 [Cryomorphaceae bacterium]|nr:hypothetical protein [Cryomorphaceae bacterium]
MESLQYYTYKDTEIICTKCGWLGFGQEATQGDLFEELFEINCPQCLESIAHISFPTFEEVLEHGSEEDKAQVRKAMALEKKVKASQTKSSKKLIDIEGAVSISFEEIHKEDKQILAVFANDQLLWKEHIYFEYFERFIDIIHQLDKKYHGQINDILYQNTTYLLGDRISAPGKIEKVVEEVKAQFKL